MKQHQMTSALGLGLLIATVAASGGCGKSDAARMEEFKKYASAGAKDTDEPEDEIFNEVASEYTPPTRATPGTAGAAGTPGQPSADHATGTTTSRAAVSAGDSAGTQVKTAERSGQISDTLQPPADPISESQRRQMAIDNMKRIAEALEMFRESKGGASYPPQYLSDSNGKPLLSWRVALLKWLGYEALYNQFKLNQPWDSTHNRKLIDKIPSVYQSPERFDAYTNFLVPASGSSAFHGPKPRPIRRWEDGLENSIILVEVDDDKSVLWTQPQDLDFNALQPRDGLGGLRRDGFFAVWGGGELTLVPQNGGNVKNAFTVDGGESTASTLKKPALAEPGGLANMFQRNTSNTVATEKASGRASGGFGATQNTAAAGTVPSRGSPYSSAPIDTQGPLAAALADAQEAFSRGREAEAVRLYYAGIASGTADPASWVPQFQWIPGLARPAAILRYGIGIEFVGTRAKSARRAALMVLAKPATNTHSTTASAAEQVYGKIAGTFGVTILDAVSNRPAHGPFFVEEAKEAETNRSRRGHAETIVQAAVEPAAKLAPLVQFIGVESERTLTAAARKHEVDVLVLFEINEKLSGRGARVREVQVALIDVVRKKRLFTTRQLNNREVLAAKIDLLADDPTPAVIDSLLEFMEQQLSPKPLPSGLRPAVAAKRVAHLGGRKDKYPLRKVAEIQLYRQLGLIELADQMQAYTNLFDQAGALILIGGSEDEKAGLLKPFLPRIPQPTSS